MKYLGNPNISVSAIDVDTNGITAPRTSGELPAFVHVSASGILGTGTVSNGTTLNPYEDFEFTWDFGDPSGSEVFTDPVTGLRKNANYQIGPEASYCYRTAGAKTITLTVRACTSPATTAGSDPSSFVTAQKTMTFTASVFDKSGGEVWADSNAVGSSNAGTLANPYTSLSSLNSAISAGHMQVWLKRGSNWAGATGLRVLYSDIRVGAYGSGNSPIINIQNASVDGGGGGGSSYNAYSSSNTSRAVSNVVISDVIFTRSGSTPNATVNCAYYGSTTNAANYNYFDNVEVGSDLSSAAATKWMIYQYGEASTATNVSGFGFWGGKFTSTATDAAGEIGFYGGARNWNFFVGLSEFTGKGDSVATNLCHHIYPNCKDNQLFRWINFGSGQYRNFCIDTNFNSYGSVYRTSNYWLIAECNITGTINGHDASNGGSTLGAYSDFQNFVVQQNAFHGLTGSAALFSKALTMTWRYNKIWNMNNASPVLYPNIGDLSSAERALNLKIYGNYVYRNNPGSQTSGISPFCQKVLCVQGTGTWSDGLGGSGTILDATIPSPGNAGISVGTLVLTANSSDPGTGVVSSLGTGTGGTGTYNLSSSFLYSPAQSIQVVQGWTTPWTITDNIIVDVSANPVLLDMQFANQATAIVDRCTWYAPNGNVTPANKTGAAFFNNRFSRTFAQYQAAGFGTNDVVADPGWYDGASGAFDAPTNRVKFRLRTS